MKVGDIITTFAPNDALVSGHIEMVEALKTRSGWRINIVPGYGQWRSYLLRPEDEGSMWIYGNDQKDIDALRAACGLGGRTPGSAVSATRKKNTL